MSAIEYGSYYWCVILNEREPGAPPETIHLHADEMSVDPTGALTFRSAGRRPAGTDPRQQAQQGQNNHQTPSGNGQESGKENKQQPQSGNMVYFALAPGSWKIVYAAKLQDGAPASVEHWTAAEGRLEHVPVPVNVGATDFPPPPR